MALYETNRRQFLSRLGGTMAAGALGSRLFASERPPVTRPRASDGDDRFEPDWDRRLTITVGRKDADLVGRDDKVLQAAVDYVARFGGGTTPCWIACRERATQTAPPWILPLPKL